MKNINENQVLLPDGNFYKLESEGKDFEIALSLVKKLPGKYAMRLPYWHKEKVIFITYPKKTAGLEFNVPHLGVTSKYGNGPYMFQQCELFKLWDIVHLDNFNNY